MKGVPVQTRVSDNSVSQDGAQDPSVQCVHQGQMLPRATKHKSIRDGPATREESDVKRPSPAATVPRQKQVPRRNKRGGRPSPPARPLTCPPPSPPCRVQLAALGERQGSCCLFSPPPTPPPWQQEPSKAHPKSSSTRTLLPSQGCSGSGLGVPRLSGA